MRIRFTLLISLGISVAGMAQTQTGFLNHKNVISVEAFANSPLILSSKNPQYALKSGKMEEKKELLNYGYGLYYARQVKKKLAFGLEVNVKNLQVEGPSYMIHSNISDQFEQVDTTWLRANPFSVNVFSGMLRFEYFNKLGNGPVGIAHVLGIGMAFSKYANKGYDYSLNEFGNSEAVESRWSKPDKFFLEKEWPLIKSIGLQYGVQMRYPVSKQIAINFGVKSLINFTLPVSKDKITTQDNAPYILENMYYNLRRENIFSINLNAGISYLF